MVQMGEYCSRSRVWYIWESIVAGVGCGADGRVL